MTPEEEQEYNKAFNQMVSWLNDHLELKRKDMLELARSNGKQGYTAIQYAIMSFSGSTGIFLKEVYEGKHKTGD
ncbi:hypothetical protein [Larkinella terrae]|uniref:Uncharacterized protein n=1 Tax=Larkinella terrae TaxID=2025311 RepID=A0A7K0ELR4_9BACT|nr:hypothetical protein [Larkinella terrae]MRS62724.1 hypothetical protein [Larkinella terrae]